MAFRWYIVHTYSGFEGRVKQSLEERIASAAMDDYFSEIVIPEENVVELVKGEKKTSKRKFFPGYILVRMELSDDTWHIVKDTPKVTGFVGNRSPSPISDEEVKSLQNRIDEGTLKPKPKISFEEGDHIKIIDGPFTNFDGMVDEVKTEKGKLRVIVSIFGRSTPVELDFIQVIQN
ncbi:MAG: transcription termination/antitermination protein NusG [Syntrophaceae bacterium]|nr:transcription termination/antitermination protein NusG [Syntrophaceae bacterium]